MEPVREASRHHAEIEIPAKPMPARFLALAQQPACQRLHVQLDVKPDDPQRNPRYPRAPTMKPLAMINPRILASSKTTVDDWEGCLSVNDLRAKVPRAEWVDVEAFNQKGERVKFHAQGFFARVIQHECDHLAGKVFLDRVPNLATLTHLHEFARYWQDE